MEMHEDGHAWIRDFYRDTRTALSPGEGLDYQNLMAGESLQRLIEALDRQLGTSGNKNFKLYEWIHHLLSVATTDGVYGKNNPFRDRQVEKDFW